MWAETPVNTTAKVILPIVIQSRKHTKDGEIYEHGRHKPWRCWQNLHIFRSTALQQNETVPKYIHQKLQLETQLGRITIC